VTYSAIEPVIYRVADWFAAHLPDYLAEADEAMVSWHDGDTFPAIFDPPAAAYEVPSLRKVGIGTSIPASGPFPYLLVALDSVDVESAGQTSDWITLHMKLVTALQENNEKRLFPALARYIDAIVHAVGNNVTLDGLVDETKITGLDKDEVPENHTGFVIADLSVKFELICD
jgi:hypothetical protein